MQRPRCNTRFQSYWLDALLRQIGELPAHVYSNPVISHITCVSLRVVDAILISDLDEISPPKATARILSNVLVSILAGVNDQLARPVEAQALYGDVTIDGRFVFFAGVGHSNLLGLTYRKAC